MDRGELLVEAGQFWAGAQAWGKPVALVDLEAGGKWDKDMVLPPCPVIGFGSATSELAGIVDAIVEPPVTLDLLVDQVTAHPNAAAAIVQLLRILPGLSREDGLTVESMAYAMLQGSGEHWAWRERRDRETALPVSIGPRLRLERDGPALLIILDRPGAGNAIDRPMRDELYEAFALASLDPTIERVHLRAEGKTFSLGADLCEFGTTTDPATAHAIRTVTLPARMAARCADKLDVHVQGACVGAGLEIAAFAGRVTASPSAWFQLPELSMGILPGAGGCVSLTHRIGRQRAAALILSGKRLSARKALAWGLVDAIVDDPA